MKDRLCFAAMHRLATLVPALALVLSGCASDDGGDGPGPAPPVLPPGGADALVADHDHGDPALHVASAGWTLAHHDPIIGSPMRQSGAHALDVKNGLLAVGVYANAADASGGVFLYDVATDPARPALVGQYTAPGSLGGDRSVELTSDARFLLVGTEATDCAGHVNPFVAGLYLVDLDEPSRPIVVDVFPGDIHSVHTHRVGDADHVWTVSALDRVANVFRIDTALPKPRLVPLGTLPISHDSTAYDDLILGRPILLTADGFRPLNMWDVSDPAAPVHLGSWEPADRGSPPAVKYYIHHASVEVIDGRRIVAVESEDWGDYPSPLWVLDWTDLDDPRILGEWVNPAGHAAQGLRWSTHNTRMADGALALAHYHAGVWTFDVRAVMAGGPLVPDGFYLPSQDVGFRPGPTDTNKPVRGATCEASFGTEFHLEDAPDTFDVEWNAGYLYAADVTSGLYVLQRAS